jgi:hypothetical protein
VPPLFSIAAQTDVRRIPTPRFHSVTEGIGRDAVASRVRAEQDVNSKLAKAAVAATELRCRYG